MTSVVVSAMMKHKRFWLWTVLILVLLMAGEAFLLRGCYGREDIAEREDSAAVRAPTYSSPALRDSVVLPDQSRMVIVVQRGATEKMIDSLENELRNMELVIEALTEQVKKEQRRGDSLSHIQELYAARQLASTRALYATSQQAAGADRQEADEKLHSAEVNRAIQQGRKAIDQRIRREGIDRHLDTLSRWHYHWPELQERIVGINSTVYDYVESLRMSFSDLDINQIREELLSYWQAWSDRTAQKIRRIKDDERNER